MAKYSVTFSCGHTQTVELFGKNSERERKISWYERSGVCSDCYKAEQDAKRQANMDACKSLPALTGTPKQIAWAEKIRAEKYDMFKGRGFDYIANETSAAWWIDHRNDVESEIYNRSQESRKQNIINRINTLSKSDVFKAAHKHAKQLKALYPDTDYRANFAESLKAIYAALKAVKASA